MVEQSAYPFIFKQAFSGDSHGPDPPERDKFSSPFLRESDEEVESRSLMFKVKGRRYNRSPTERRLPTCIAARSLLFWGDAGGESFFCDLGEIDGYPDGGD